MTTPSETAKGSGTAGAPRTGEPAGGLVVARPADDALDMRRYYQAPVALMWRLWTDPDHFARWWGPVGMRCTRCEIDLRPGGKWLTVITGQDGATHTVGGTYLEVESPHRLVYSWRWQNESGPGHESQVIVTFRAMGEGCELHILHQGLGPGQPDTHLHRWTGCLESLARHLSETSN
jgi:uncharacterized protein YndB with AHSA1/START domain